MTWLRSEPGCTNLTLSWALRTQSGLVSSSHSSWENFGSSRLSKRWLLYGGSGSHPLTHYFASERPLSHSMLKDSSCWSLRWIQAQHIHVRMETSSKHDRVRSTPASPTTTAPFLSFYQHSLLTHFSRKSRLVSSYRLLKQLACKKSSSHFWPCHYVAPPPLLINLL